MASYSTNEFKGGLKLILDGDPVSIIENELVKPGKGQAFNRVKLRNLRTRRVIEKTFKSGESVEAADVLEMDLEFSYNDDEFWYFMDPVTYEQVAAPAAAVEDVVKLLKPQELCQVTLWDGVPLMVALPNFVELKIAQTDPGLKGDTAQGATKPATLESGGIVKVPLFIEEGEMVKVDTRTGEYVSRVKG